MLGREEFCTNGEESQRWRLGLCALRHVGAGAAAEKSHIEAETGGRSGSESRASGGAAGAGHGGAHRRGPRW